MVARQLFAAISRSGGLICTCTSFSASEKVAEETGGPAAGVVPNAGGAPGGNSAAGCEAFWQAVDAPSTAMAALLRNCLRESDMNYCIPRLVNSRALGNRVHMAMV